MTEKQTIRKRVAELKSIVSREQMQAEADAVFSAIELDPVFYAATKVLAYWSLPDELPTHNWIKKWSAEKEFYLPVVDGNDMKSAPLSTNKTNTALVKKVGKNIAVAVETYLRNNGMESEIANLSWEYSLVKDTSQNAFCMPGGKIVVYEGILPVTKNETGLAVVLGHVAVVRPQRRCKICFSPIYLPEIG